MNKKLITLLIILITLITSFGTTLRADETEKAEPAPALAPKVAEKLVFDTDWKGETISLPPDFAPDMKWKGTEVIRFAPGMFDPKSDEFFSYAFVFAVSKDQPLTKEVIQTETLAYYRGLARSVLKSRGKEVDTAKFTFALKQEEAATDTPKGVPADKITPFSGQLQWIEPFATENPQLLHFELQAWTDTKTEMNYLFVCTSPKPAEKTTKIWQDLRTIRQKFVVE